MYRWTIYGKNGSAKAVTDTLELHDEWMAECFVTLTIKSATPVEFGVGDYIDYRGERYTIEYDPTVLKKASRGSYGEGFTYENIKFVSVADEIVRCDFNDIVLADNNLHYTSLSTFPFYCQTVDDLLDRIQANLEDLYPGQWTVISIDEGRTAQRGAAVERQAQFEAAYSQYIGGSGSADYEKTGVALTANNITCWDAMKMVHDDFALNFVVRGRVIVVGAGGASASNVFHYGKGNGLYELEKIGDPEQQIITRLRAYGAETNMPKRYYANLNMAVFAFAAEAANPNITMSPSEEEVYGANLDLDFRKDYFTNPFHSGQTEVTVRIGSTSYDASVWNNGTTGQIILHLYTEVSVPIGTKIYFTSGVNRDAWPSDHREYGTDNLPDNMAISRLMLPGFPNKSLSEWVEEHKNDSDKVWLLDAVNAGYTFSTDKYRPYIDSPNKAKYGVRPASMYFDGSDENEDIHPTIEGTGLDIVYAAEHITDNGVYDEEDPEPFTITLPALGFDLADYYNSSDDTPTIEMKNGMCGARPFKIVDEPEQTTGNRWACKVERYHDDSLDLWFPYNDFNIHGSSEAGYDGDKYVLTGINMPDEYINLNAIRLLKAAIEALAKNHEPRYTYQPRIDEIFMQREYDDAVAHSRTPLHDKLHAGDLFAFYDEDIIGVDGQSSPVEVSIIIDVLTIRENGNNGIPTYEVTLRDEKEVGQIQKMQNKIDSFGGKDYELLGSDRFLSKINDDTAQGFIRFMKGLQVGERFVPGLLGEGGVFRTETDGTTYIEADRLYIRMKAYFDTVEIREYQHSAGNRIASVAGAKCIRVEWIKMQNGSEVIVEQKSTNLSSVDFFRCYFRGSDGDSVVRNNFVVGDLVYCHITTVDGKTDVIDSKHDSTSQQGSSHLNQTHYWRLCIGRNTEGTYSQEGEAWVDISNAHDANGNPTTNTISGTAYASFQAGSDVPEPQDSIIQLGNVNDIYRQGAIVEMVTGADAPSYQIYQAIGADRQNLYSLADKNYIILGYATGNSNLHSAGHAYLEVMGDFYFGARPASGQTEGSTYIKYNSTNQQLDIKANVTFTSPDPEYGTSDLNAFIQAVTNDVDNIHNQIDGQIESWFYDYMPVREDEGAPADTVPLTNKEPYKSWYQADHGGTASEVTTERLKHLGDTFYDNTSGYAFRFSNTGTEQSPVFAWVVIQDSAVIKALADAEKAQDTADHKRRVFVLPVTISGTTYNYPYPPYDVGDLWVNAKYPYNTGATYNNEILKCKTAKGESGSFAIGDWEKASKYTDDSSLLTFLDGYSGTLTDVRDQIDEKAETWYQNTDPSTDWTTAALKAAHVGDLWYCTADISGTSFKKDTTWYYKVTGGTAQNPTYGWVQQNIPQSVFDTIDGKKAIYVTWNGWVVSNVNKLQVRDLFIPQANVTKNSVTYKANKVYRCLTVGVYNSSGVVTTYPTFQEVAYTDDTRINNFVNEILNGTGASGNDKTVADAIRTVNAAVNDNMTTINGGLVLTTMIVLRNGNTTWSGISGAYDSSATGGGIAAWYGGAMVDHEVNTTATDYAKSLFRFDGSGYVASGNLKWDNAGNVTIQGYSINASSIQVGSVNVALATDLASYLPLSAGSGKKLTGTLYSQSILPKSTTTYDLGGTSNYWNKVYTKKIYLTNTVYFELDSSNNVKLNGNFCATGSVSALGSGTGGGGGVTLNKPLSTINTAFGNANPTSANQTLVWNGSTWTYGSVSGGSVNMADVWTALAANTTEQINSSHLTTALSGYVTQVKVGTTAYNPANGVVSLPAYPSTLDSIADGTTRKLADYLPLTAGSSKQLTGDLYIHKATSTTESRGLIYNIDPNNDARYMIYSRLRTQSDDSMREDFYVGSGMTVLTFMDKPAGTYGYARLVLGNSTGRSTANNMYGCILLYGSSAISATSAYYALINPSQFTANRTLTLPDKTGTFALLTDKVSAAETADALASSVTIWGQSFDGTANVDGTMTVSGSVIIKQGSSSRNNGVMGSYDSTRAATVWAMSSNYNIASDGSGLGTLYGFAYAYKNLASVGNLAGGHQIVFANAGTVYVAFGSDGLWSTGIKCTGNATIGGTLGVTGATTISGTLGVTGAATLSSTLSVASGITLTTTKRIYFGDSNHYIELNSTGFHFSHGLYSDSFISAFGAQSGSGGITLNQPLSGINSSGLGTPSNGQTLVYNSSTSKWTYQTLNTSGVDMAAVWTAMATPAASSSVEQIDASHLAGALSGYATTSDLSGYLPLTGGTLTGNLTGTKIYGDLIQPRVLAINHYTDGFSGSNIRCAIGYTSGSIPTSYCATPTNRGAGTYMSASSTSGYSRLVFTALSGIYLDGTAYVSGNTIWHAGNSNLSTVDWACKALTTAGAATVGGTLGVTGAAAMSSALTVNGDIYANAYLRLFRAVTENSDTHVKTSDQRMYMRVPTAGSDTNNYAFRFYATFTPQTDTTPAVTSYTTYLTGGIGSITFTTGAAGAQLYQTLTLGNSTKRNHQTAPSYAGRIQLYQPQNEGASATVRVGIIQTAVLTASRIYTLPDATGTIALTTSNVASATKLQTARTIWGQSFDGSANVTGDMSSVGDIAFSASGKKIGGFLYFDTTNSCLGINTNSPAEKLHVAGNVTLSADSRIYQQYSSSGDLYLGRSDNSGWVRISDMCSNGSKTYWAIYANGEFKARKYTFLKTSDGSDSGCYFQWYSGSIVKLTGSLYVTGGVTALTTSDIRKKNISSNVDKLTVEDVADAPIFNFTWKNMIDNKMHLGTSAQYWHPLLQNAVSIMDDGYLGMDYGATALAAAVITARKVVDHETRIRQLEEENKRLRYELETIKAA